MSSIARHKFEVEEAYRKGALAILHLQERNAEAATEAARLRGELAEIRELLGLDDVELSALAGMLRRGLENPEGWTCAHGAIPRGDGTFARVCDSGRTENERLRKRIAELEGTIGQFADLRIVICEGGQMDPTVAPPPVLIAKVVSMRQRATDAERALDRAIAAEQRADEAATEAAHMRGHLAEIRQLLGVGSDVAVDEVRGYLKRRLATLNADLDNGSPSHIKHSTVESAFKHLMDGELAVKHLRNHIAELEAEAKARRTQLDECEAECARLRTLLFQQGMRVAELEGVAPERKRRRTEADDYPAPLQTADRLAEQRRFNEAVRLAGANMGSLALPPSLNLRSNGVDILKAMLRDSLEREMQARLSGAAS